MFSRTVILSLTLLVILPGGIRGQIDSEKPSGELAAVVGLSSMPLTFTENQGQWHENVLFKAEADGSIFFFCANEIVYLLIRETDQLVENSNEHRRKALKLRRDELPREFRKEVLIIRARFVNANPDHNVYGVDPLPYRCNYFHGNDPSKWCTGVPNYSAIIYKDIIPGIDLRYRGDGTRLKYDILVNPGADLSQIRIRFEGVDSLAIDGNGRLRAETGFGPISESKPLIYQDNGGIRRQLTGHHVIYESQAFGIVLDDSYDQSLPLVIDPELVYCTYIGGSRNDEAYDIAIDHKGNAYVTGMVRSYDFPVVNPFDDSLGYNQDAFVTKISAEGDEFVYSTYIGSADPHEGADFGDAIEIDEPGCAYITGYAGAADFPIVGAYDSTFNGVADAFLLKLAPEGNSLVFSTFLGGDHVDVGYGLIVDDARDIYLVGRTRSSDFPAVNAYDESPNDTSHVVWGDVFITKFLSSGDALLYSTYLGGSGSDVGLEIAVDPYGNAYVGGWTESDDFPLVNSFDSTHAGESDAFIARLSSAGSDLIYSTLLGTSERDVVIDIEVDPFECAYVCGYTEQPGFPTVNAYDYSFNGETDVFVSKIAPEGNSLVYSTYLGGARQDAAYGLELDSSCCAYITGRTASYDFPLVNPYDESMDGGDVFITRFSPSGNSLLFSTYVGASDYEQAEGIEVSDKGDIYVAGYTYSSDFATPFAFDTSFGGYSDGFAFRLSMTETQVLEPVPEREGSTGNYPNPFNTTTVIRYTLTESSFVTVSIYDLLGRKLETLFTGEQMPGEHSVTWHADGFSSGIYFYRIQGDFTDTRKMVLLK